MRPGWIGLRAVALYVSATAGVSAKSTLLDVAGLFNNKAFGKSPGEAAFDALNQSYPDPGFDGKTYISQQTGIEYSFPGYTGPGTNDNVICAGQKIDVPADSPSFSVSFLVAGDLELASVSKNVTFEYSDGSTSLYELRTLSWFNLLTINRGEIVFPSRFTADGINYNTSHIFERTASLSPGKRLASITLPSTTNTSESRLHVFAISVYKGSALSVQSVRPTQKWFGNGTQIVEVTVNNAGSECAAGKGLSITLEGDGFATTRPGVIKRLCPGDQIMATVGIDRLSNTAGTTKTDVKVLVAGGQNRTISSTFSGLEVGLVEWTSDLSSLEKHEAPEWFDESKYGIFLHWGPYAVTGWGNSSPHESYAEWFWWYSTNHPQGDRSNFYGYRRDTFGEDWAYDDTFPKFTAEKFDAKAIVDLVADAGAKYFVLTSKHHDGFAIFDAGGTSNRSSIHHGPRRDLLGELFSAAAEHHPDMKRGAYFSLPEWFNPDFARYGFDQFNKTLVPSTVSWPGGPARNPYTGALEPYTGHSYGYNRATRDDEYMNATAIVRTLVDIVSKNGNFLLNIGPRADGTIVPRAAENLREAGSWIRRHGEAVYNTTYWFVQSQVVEGGAPDVRFTHGKDAFYVFFLERPRPGADGFVRIPAAVPVLAGDGVSLLGVEGGEKLDFRVDGDGSGKSLSIKVADELLAKEDICWVFKIEYLA
ncbi:tissue alpha-L-fucosidase [Magnaporthiopsis poae ATCC 64411]|uniref:alpha-L-fucosidase n=1 Tax=Magnaporthiopsis poae (strain ATCC 64411 / 73-15) TaxID=644358 RepID=A0A0C4E0T0_MAGP6|nr:tissue alpha-L-fucosidase [Magnaporthiopsis poae ATCC 64411]